MLVITLKPGLARGLPPSYSAKHHPSRCPFLWDEEAAWVRIGAFTDTLLLRKLFGAKILQALKDLGTKGKHRIIEIEREAAELFFDADTVDFFMSCDLAGIKPGDAKEAARRIRRGELNVSTLVTKRVKGRKYEVD